MKKIEVLIADDSALMRKNIKEMLESDPEIKVVGFARNGEDAIEKARYYNPDVITLDINMPKMDGITALQILVEENIAPIIMLSSLTQEGSLITFEALELGAFDFVAKPGGTVSLNIKQVKDELIAKVKAAANGKTLKKLIRKTSEIKIKKRKRHQLNKRKAVAIGISTGGPKTLLDVIPYLPEDLPADIFIVQHMPPTFTKSFAQRLDKNSHIRVVEAEAGIEAENGLGILGKGGYHLTLFKKMNQKIIVRTPSIPKSMFMPSVNVMMDSVLSIYKENTIGVLMTGMGDDGADAMVKIKKNGGITIAESEETAIVFGMPREAIERGGADFVEPSYNIAERIIQAVYEEI